MSAALGCGPGGDTGRVAPDFDLPRVGGGRLALKDLRGKLVLLDFWATWCVPCVRAIPELNALYRSQRERGVEVIGIAVDDLEEAELAAWLAEKGVEYPVVRADADLAAAYDAYVFPQHVLVSAQGTILDQLEPGVHSSDALEARIARHLD